MAKTSSANLAEGQPKTAGYRVAAASSDGIVINQHFGRADIFYIYEVTGKGNYRFLETRTVTVEIMTRKNFAAALTDSKTANTS